MTMANKKKKTATTNAGAKSKEQLVIHQIVVKAPQRKVYDVGNWRTALSSADNGRTKQLYDLLDDIMIDGVLSDAVQKRIDAVKLFRFLPGIRYDPDKSELFSFLAK